MTSLSSVRPRFAEALAHPGRCRTTELGVKVSAFVSSKDAQLRYQRLSYQKSISVRQSVAVRASAPPQGGPLEERTFSWKGFANEVLLTGDFLNWDLKVPLAKGANDVFTVVQNLPPGRYSYKFIIDGVWQHSPLDPTISDGAGGFNNVLVIEDKTPPKPDAEVPAEPAAPAPAPKAAAPAAPAAAAGGKKVAGKAGGKKAAAKPIKEAMTEDIIPALTTALSKEEGLSSLELTFTDNTLCGSFIKNNIPFSFWAFFPDGTLDGSRGFSLTSYGNAPSTIEPFIIDERKVTPELLVFWVCKRLFAQKLLALN